MDVYLDTSALVKRFVQETGSPRVVIVASSMAHHEYYSSALTAVEVAAAITRMLRGGRLSANDAQMALADAAHDATTLYTAVEPSSAVLGLARDLAVYHGLRGYDAVHLATAVLLGASPEVDPSQPAVLVTSDRELLAAAQAEGLLVEDPTDPTTFVL